MGGEDAIPYTDVLWKCTPETYIALLTSVAPIIQYKMNSVNHVLTHSRKVIIPTSNSSLGIRVLVWTCVVITDE